MVVCAVTLGEDNFLARNYFLLNPVNLEPQESIFFASKRVWGVVAALYRVFVKMSKLHSKSRVGGVAYCDAPTPRYKNPLFRSWGGSWVLRLQTRP